MTDTGQSVDVKNLVESAGRSADSELSIIVLGGRAVGADTSNDVVSVKADTDVVDKVLIEGANRNIRLRGWGRRNVRESTSSVDKSISGDAEA